MFGQYKNSISEYNIFQIGDICNSLYKPLCTHSSLFSELFLERLLFQFYALYEWCLARDVGGRLCSVYSLTQILILYQNLIYSFYMHSLAVTTFPLSTISVKGKTFSVLDAVPSADLQCLGVCKDNRSQP